MSGGAEKGRRCCREIAREDGLGVLIVIRRRWDSFFGSVGLPAIAAGQRDMAVRPEGCEESVQEKAHTLD